MRIGICVPSRGLVFSKVIQAIEEIRQGYDTKLYFSSDLPIPDGHNQLTQQALKEGADYILFIEEDCVAPTGAIEKLLAVKSDIVCIDYGVSGWGCVAKDTKDQILWCGLGVTLVKKAVFEALEYPYFRVDKVLRQNDWTWQTLPESYIQTKQYGSLDIWFCCQAREKGFTIGQVEGLEADHLLLSALGQKEANHGLHVIELKPKITKKQILNYEGGWTTK